MLRRINYARNYAGIIFAPLDLMRLFWLMLVFWIMLILLSIHSSVGSVVLVNITLNTATVAYYTGTTAVFRACFACDESSNYMNEIQTSLLKVSVKVVWKSHYVWYVVIHWGKFFVEISEICALAWNICRVWLGISMPVSFALAPAKKNVLKLRPNILATVQWLSSV